MTNTFDNVLMHHMAVLESLDDAKYFGGMWEQLPARQIPC